MFEIVENLINQIQDKFLKDRDEQLLRVCNDIIKNNLPFALAQFPALDSYNPIFNQYEKNGATMLKVDLMPSNKPMSIYKITRQQAEMIINEHKKRINDG